MIISRTPLRVSFCGGGTDQPAYYMKHGGEVVSVAIDKCIYVTINEKFDGRVHLRYSKTENVPKAGDIQHTIVRECLKLMKVKKGVEIVTISDVPMQGTGLGSSSSLTVGLLNALHTYKGKKINAKELAEMACYVEINILKAPIGKQDQYAAVYGGLNRFKFHKGGVIREDLYQKCSSIKIKWLEESTMLFYLNKQREGNHILAKQIKGIEDNKLIYDAMKGLVHDFIAWLKGDMPSPVVGQIIDMAWQNKKQLCGQVSNSYIDKFYNKAKGAGALGGKVAGAGGGGFIMLIVPKEHQQKVRESLYPLKEMGMQFDEEGSRIIYHED